MNLDKLKEAARKFEQREEWRRAIDVYLQAIREAEEAGGEGTQDPALYNRVGDLEMRAGDALASLRAYEQAAELYADQGFFNNAIALCGKILRANPSRTATYLRLAQLHARKNFVGEAKKNLLEYLDRMNGVGQLEEAFAAVKLFADQFSANPDIRLMLVELLRASSRTEEAKEQLEKLATELEARGDATGARRTRARLHAIDVEGPVGHATRPSPNDLVFLDTGEGRSVGVGGPDQVEGLVSSASEQLVSRPAKSIVVDTIEHAAESLDASAAGGEALSVDGSAMAGAGEAWNGDVVTLDGLDLITADSASPVEGVATEEDLPMIELDEGALEWGETLRTEPSPGWLADGAGEAALAADTPESLRATEFDDVEAAFPPAAKAPPASGVGDLMFLQLQEGAGGLDPSVAIEPGTALLDRARQLLDLGDREGGVHALSEALRLFEAEGRWGDALQVAGDLVRLEPESVDRYQKQVEVAYRAGERPALVAAYLELADALVRRGAVDHAVHVYRHVLEHEPDNQPARTAIALLMPTPMAPAPPAAEQPLPADDFVDLGALILDDQQVRDTRMRVDQGDPIENEDQAFHEALADFKRGIEANLDADDFQSHYDLGIAFKEMGLIDEAIAQFQKALRSPEGRLKTSEQLGIAFYEKGQFTISEAVLRRAVEGLAGADDEKIGLIYWFGRALEAQHRGREALPLYERALAVDIRFLDLSERVKRLSSEAPR